MQGDYPYWGANAIVDHVDRWLFDEELILLGEDGAPFFDKDKPVAFLVNGKIWVNNHTHVLRPAPHVDARFLVHVLNVNDYSDFIEGSTRDKLTQGKMREIPVPLPDLPEQRAIADFLDKKTAAIDALIAKKERLLALLDEKRQAVITQAVTKGIGPPVPMKDSGVEWLESVPAHWCVERTKALFSERQGRSTTGDEEMLTVSHLTGVTPRSEKTVYMTEAETTEGYKLVKKNDLAVNTMWAWMGALGVAPCDGIVSPAYNVYVPRDPRGVRFHDLLVRTPAFVAEINRWSKGIWKSRLRLYPTEFFQLMLPVPPPAERERIVAHVASSTAADRRLADVALRSIELLREYRQALITAAVTGQLDVRSKQARAMEPAA